MLRIAIVLAAALLFTGCAALRASLVVDAEERQVLDLVAYAQRISVMTAEERRREYSAASQAFGKDKGTYNRLRLALLFASPGASVHDDARAASLLEPLAAPGDAAGPLRSLAGLLYAQVAERQREQKRAEQMRDQLEELKAVERTIIERGQQSRSRRR